MATAWVGVLAGSHDLGKASPGFQAKWPPGRQTAEAAGFGFAEGLIRLGDRHDAFSHTILSRALRDRAFPPKLRRMLVWSVSAHHGFGVDAEAPDSDIIDALPLQWRQAHMQLFDLLIEHAFFRVGDPVSPSLHSKTPGWLREWLAGLISVADWIGSDLSYFPHGRPWHGYQHHWQDSQRLAAEALDAIGLVAGPPLTASSTRDHWLGEILGGRSSRPMQSAVVDALQGCSSPLMVVVEAPMGEGKTELALWIALDQARQGQRGVYFALPTQATANGLAPRVASFLRQFGADDVPELQIVHGDARRLRRLLEPQGVDGGTQDGLAASWFERGRRSLIAPIGVGTIDQALIGVLNAKHRFVRLFALADRLVILDEVHAYDTYTSGLIERLIRWLGSMDASVILMSATLPHGRRDGLVGAWLGSEPVQLPPTPYPRALVVRRGKTPCVVPFAASRQSVVSVHSTPSETESVAAKAASLVVQGGCILVVCNTVGRAQGVYSRLKASGEQVLLFHARFPADERAVRETEVLQCFGPDGRRPQRMIVVATQVVEQSLDVDFDALVTDLAPVDLLLQRIGRVHRHARPARPHAQACAWVAGLDESLGAVLKQVTPICAAGPVVRTKALLAGRHALNLPDDIDRLVQAVYAPSFAWPHDMAEEGQRADAATLNAMQAHAQLAANAGLPAPTAGEFPVCTVRQTEDAAEHSTRLGVPSVSVIPVYTDRGRYSTLPNAGIQWGADDMVPTAAARVLGNRPLRVSHPRLVGHLFARDARLAGWDRHGALANHKPLMLDGDGYSLEFPSWLRLDRDLGLVYEQRSP